LCGLSDFFDYDKSIIVIEVITNYIDRKNYSLNEVSKMAYSMIFYIFILNEKCVI